MLNEKNMIPDFQHTIDEKVKFHEVDLLGICNNAVYFNYFEDARIKYLQDLKSSYNLKEILEGNSFFIMARNECNYINPARFDDDLQILTKITFIKQSSFGFRHLVVNKKSNITHAEGAGILVHINFMTKSKIDLPQEFFNAVLDYEKEVELLK